MRFRTAVQTCALPIYHAPAAIAGLGIDLHRPEPILGAVVAEDVAEARRDHGIEALLLDGPHRVLPGRAGAEVGAADEHVGALELLLVQDEGRIVTPLREQALLEHGPLDLLEPVGRDEIGRASCRERVCPYR